MIDALPEAFLDALGDAVREVRQQGERELERISAEARATIAELNAKVVELAGVVRSLADEQVGRVSAAVVNLKDGAPGRDGRDAEPLDMAQVETIIAAKVDERVEAKAASIPVPKDGHSPTADELLSVIEPLVLRMFADIPVPQDGQDGADGQNGKDAEPVTPQQIAEAIKSAPEMFDEAVARHLEANPPPAGRDGVDGKDAEPGPAGKDADPITKDQIVEAVLSCDEAIRAAVGAHLTDNPPPGGSDGKDGAPGEPGREGRDADPVDYESVQKFIVDRIAEFPVPKDGLDGINGKDGVGVAGGFIDKSGSLVLTLSDGTVRDLGCVVGKDAVPGPAGPAGKDASPITKDQIIEAVLACDDTLHEAVAKHLTDNPPLAGRDGADGAPGHPGRDGRDAEPVTKEQIVEAVLACDNVMQEAVIKHLTDNPPPAGRDGRDGDPGAAGKDAEPFDYGSIQEFMLARIAEIPVPKDGADGKDGVGLAGAFINRSGSLVVTLSNGSVQELERVEGKSVEPAEIREIVRSEIRGLEVKAPDVSESAFSSHLLGMIDVAHRALSEPLVVRSGEQSTQAPLTLNVGPPVPAPKPMRKTIHTRRDENGDLVADVTESEA